MVINVCIHRIIMSETVTSSFCMFKDTNASWICIYVRDIAENFSENSVFGDICFIVRG